MNGRVNSAHHTRVMPILSLVMAMFLVAGLFAIMGAPVLGQDDADQEGYSYTVQNGDSWDIVAAKTGVSVEALKAANPDSVRDTGWLLTDEKLTIPLPADVPSKTHSVGNGESWSSIAEDYGISVTLLQAANQKSQRPGLILYKGEKLVIPPAVAAPPVEEEAETPTEPTPETEETATETEDADAEDTSAEESSAEAETATDTDAPEVEAATEVTETVETEVPVEAEEETVTEAEDAAGDDAEETSEEVADEATEEVAEEPSAEAASEVAEDATPEETTEEMTSTEVLTETVIETEVPAAVEEEAATEEDGTVGEPIACPDMFADYPDSIVAVLNAEEGSPEALESFLETCGALVEGGVVAADLTGDGQDEVVVVYQNPSQDASFVESDLIILSLTDDGYEVTYRARAAGEVRLLATDDINEDGQMDVAWVDTTCGASTCFDTVNVRSWDGSVWADWTDGTITMAYADIELADATEDSSGQEIQLTGGIYGSVGAGPQRSRTEVWSSVDGEPYTLSEKSYSDSECLYHAVLDANRALQDAATPEEMEAARAMYESAVIDESLIKCWVRPGELEELRSFSLFRLAVIAAYDGDLEAAADRIAELAATYPNSVMDGAGQAWLESVEADGVLIAACEAVTAYAEANPEVWEILADYGYTNPSFEANDLCPPPEVSGEDTEETAEDGATGASPRSDPGAVSAPETSSASDAESDSEAVESVEADDLPDCPATLVDYAEALPGVLTEVEGDKETIERWMYACGALAEDRGAVVVADLNGDDVDDFVLYPTLISDVGLGPEGAQGAVHILHSLPDGAYKLVSSPDVFGEPAPLAVDDLNADGILDVAWTVEGCSTFCVLETQMVSSVGEDYVSIIQPGAAIASGEASLVPVGEDDVGSGQALVLSGGVSGTPEGGLTVSHEETWQSVEGQPYERVSWVYDRAAPGSNCMGLRMIEADVALQASDVLGYEPAIELYAEALDPELEACSIFGLRPDEELVLLQGLASFRLIQAQALSDDVNSAGASLDLLSLSMPDSPYTGAAKQWLADFTASGDAGSACEAIASILEDNPDLWQITDHYGYNHPALAAEQICYAP